MNKSRGTTLKQFTGIIVLLGVVSHLPNLMDVAVEHFDEGVYASNLFMGPPDFRYPFQELYAPPLLPSLMEWRLILTGSLESSVISLVFESSILLLIAIGWTANELLRRDEKESSTGPLTPNVVSYGVAAAMLLAVTSEILIQYSRTALTDIPLTLFLTLAVGAGTRGLRRNDWRWVILAGVFTSLAWWTKYNGWLPIAILGAGIAGWFVFGTRDWKQTQPALLKWGVITTLAILLWLPCLQGLQATGGYAAVAANHAKYVFGFSNWFDFLNRHLQFDRFYSGWLTASGFLFAFTVPSLYSTGTSDGLPLRWNNSTRLLILGLATLLAGLCWWGGALPVLVLLNVTAVVLTLLTPRPENQPRFTLGHWILAAWILGLLVATPMYRPYPRLILPLVVGLCIGAGWGIELILRRVLYTSPATTQNDSVGNKIWNWGVLAVFMVILFILPLVYPPVALGPRPQFREIARQVSAAIRKDLVENPRPSRTEGQALVAVYGEPGLFFNLARDPQKLVIQPIGTTAPLTSSAGSSDVPTYLITGPHSGDAAQELEGLTDRVRQVASFDYVPSPLVLLDSMTPAESLVYPPVKIQVWTRLQ